MQEGPPPQRSSGVQALLRWQTPMTTVMWS
jgi:hypothetical protein